nr:exosortase C-terminal domain/associated protein EpsI [Sphingomonas sp. GC_Shp_3]
MRRRDLIGAGVFAGLAATASAGAIAFRRAQQEVPVGRGTILTHLPAQLGSWHLQAARADMIDPVVVDIAFSQALEMYDRVIERDYVSPVLPRIMLNIAYKREVRQEERFHWPEFCYATQGFHVKRLAPIALGPAGDNVTLTQFVGQREERRERVGYFMRIGNAVPSGSLAVRAALFRQSLAMHLPDGVMVRASFLEDDIAQGGATTPADLLARFFRELVQTASAPLGEILVNKHPKSI